MSAKNMYVAMSVLYYIFVYLHVMYVVEVWLRMGVM